MPHLSGQSDDLFKATSCLLVCPNQASSLPYVNAGISEPGTRQPERRRASGHQQLERPDPSGAHTLSGEWVTDGGGLNMVPFVAQPGQEDLDDPDELA